ncbi:MAG: asparagine synthetase B, partial [Bacteroidota bacterium]|nr:asparagine synthetase B [Bacteroidota bacterium]
MCGISGILKLKGSSIELLPAARRMNSTLRHRGPDGEGLLLVDASGNTTTAFTEDTPNEIYTAAFPHSPKTSAAQINSEAHFILSHRRLAIQDLS